MHDVRAATTLDGPAVAEVYLAARHAAVPSIPPLVHDDDDVRRHLHDHVVATHQVHVVEAADGRLIGFLASTPGWIDHLYVHPAHHGQGVGTALLDVVKAHHDTLDLWTFLSNDGARRFYDRHGFVEVDRTDGDNEERAPDVRLRWSRSP